MGMYLLFVQADMCKCEGYNAEGYSEVIIRTETESNLFLLSTQLSLYVQRYDNLGN